MLQNFVENQPRLVAFVVMKPDVRAPTPRELRLAIGGFLQSEFVPTAVMQLPSIRRVLVQSDLNRVATDGNI